MANRSQRGDLKSITKTSSWREQFKSHCKERAIEARRKILQNKRSNVPDQEMEETLDSIISTEIQNLQSNGYDQEIEDFEEIERFLKESLLDELKREEAEFLRQALEFEEKSMESMIESHYSNGLICPVCLKSHLMTNKGIIFCSCGVRVDTQNDQISLDQVREQLAYCFSEHLQVCKLPPKVTFDVNPAFQGLVMSCTNCSFFQIVL